MAHYSWSCVCTIFKLVCTYDVTYFYFQSLLFATDPAHCGEVAEGWKLAQCQDALEYFLEVVFVNCSLVTNVTDIFYVLDLIDSGYFDFVLVLPPAAAWSRARHKSNAGQDPLRSRSFPLGIPSLSPDAQSKVLLDDEHLEYAAWILECFLLCERAKVDSILVFPEDPGGHEHHGPAAVWQLREFQVLECDHDARRGAGFLCQLAHAEQKRPVGTLTTLAALHSDLCMGWPKFVLDQDELRYVGPLPRDCGCPAQLSPMVGYNPEQIFFSSISPTLGPLFWKRVWKAEAEEKLPLRDAKSVDHFSSSSQGPSFVSGVDSRQRLFNLWRSRSLSRESLRQWAEAKEASAYMASIGKLLSSNSLPLSSSFSCTGFSGLPRRECCCWFASFVCVVISGYGYSTGRHWYWHSFAYTFKVTQNFEKTNGFVEAEGRWQCRASLVIPFYSGGHGER